MNNLKVTRKSLVFGGFFLLVVMLVFVGAGYFPNENDQQVFAVEIEKGWNLVYGFSNPNQIRIGDYFEEKDIKAIYGFISITQEYARAYPDPEYDKLQLMDDDELLQTTFWVYSEKEGLVNYIINQPFQSVEERKMYSGWNFFAISPDLIFEDVNMGRLKDESFDLNLIKGSCNIEGAYFFENGRWDIFNEEFNEDMIGLGLVIKVANDCYFSKPGSTTSPPGLPIETTLPEGDTTICEDSDNGQDYFTFGITSYGYGEGIEFTGAKDDTCDFYSEGAESRVGLLREGYCDGVTYKEDLIKCVDGFVCREGKCVEGDFSLSMCSDTDNGKERYIYGKIVGIGGTGDDTCYNDAVGSLTSECSGEGCSVYEYYCDGELKAWEIISCPNGCADGACIKETTTCEDSDGGKDYYVKGTTSGIKWGADYLETYEDVCLDDNADGDNLKEAFCINNQVTFEFYNCPNGCADGACIEETTTCEDSDGGKNYYVKGEFSGMWEGRFITNIDSCVDALDETGDDVYSSNYLGEVYCENGVLKVERITCQNRCQDGVCIQ